MSARPFSVILITIFFGALLVSCSGPGTSTLSPGLKSPETGESICLGVFKIIQGEDMSSATIERDRLAQFDVTRWAEIEILDAQWDGSSRTWTLTVKVSNPTPFTGYGVQAIFTELGGKELRWPDGFTWKDFDGDAELERYPFFAIEKETEGRIFQGFHSSTRDLVFYFPPGVDMWVPIRFIIDANLGEPRHEPMVEDMQLANTPPPCYHSTVLANVSDHQSEPYDLSVWVDLTPIRQDAETPMFDDGDHDDFDAGDGIFGAEFTGGIFGELYTFTVYAEDPEGNTGENDIFYSPIEYPPLPPLEFSSLRQGQHCLITSERFEVIRDQDSFDTFWTEFTDDDSMPPIVDFNVNNVIAVCLGQRDNDCYWAEITDYSYSSENCGVRVDYTETVPEDGCPCAEVITTPYHLVTATKSFEETMFVGDIFIDCPEEPCLDLFELRSGTYGRAETKSKSVIMDQSTWESWWASTVGGGNPPSVDFDTEMVIGVTQGECRTSGYYPTVDSACWDDTMQLEIEVTWHVPGFNCMVLDVITNPWAAYKCEKVMLPYFWTEYTDIYRCD